MKVSLCPLPNFACTYGAPLLILALLAGCSAESGMAPSRPPSLPEMATPPEPPAPDHRLPLDVTYVDSARYDVQPGEVVCLEPGARPFLVLNGLQGRPDAPITLTNCPGGTARLGGDRFGIVLRHSKHLRVVGSASPDDRLGLVVDGGGEAKVGVSVDQRSTDVELGFLEIKNTTFAGIVAKTEDANAGVLPEERFVLQNLHVHDTYVHHTGGEGMYLGSSTVGPGQHRLTGLRVHNNVVAQAGWDGIQVSNATDDAEVHHNVIYQSGTKGQSFHGNGLQIGGNAAGAYHHNLIVDSHIWGLAVFGTGRIDVEKTLISGSQGVFVDDRKATRPDVPIRVRANSFQNIQGTVVQVLNDIAPVLVSENRLDGDNDWLGTSDEAEANVSLDQNTRVPLDSLRFPGKKDGNFCLLPASPYAGMGLSHCQ